MAQEFPHLLPEERALWRKFLALHEKDWDRYIYDVHVGEGRQGPEYLGSQPRRWGTYLTQKRIDVVGERADRVCIFEIRPAAGMAQIGQLLCYRFLYQRQTRDRRPCELAIVTGKVWPDEQWLFDQFNIKVYSFPD